LKVKQDGSLVGIVLMLVQVSVALAFAVDVERRTMPDGKLLRVE